MREVDLVRNRREPHGAAQVVGLAASIDEALEGVNLGRRYRLEH